MDNFNFIKLKKPRCNVYDNLKVVAGSLHKKDIHIFHLNIRSIRKHFDEVKLFLNSITDRVKIDILALTEVNLQENDIFPYEIDGYKNVKKLRPHKKRRWNHYICQKQHRIF